MKANQLTIVGHTDVRPSHSSFSVGSLFAKLGGGITRLLGCWHTDMSHPISIQGQTYRTCLDCGAQRKFNLEKWEMQGSFYYRVPAASQLRALAPVRSRRRAALPLEN